MADETGALQHFPAGEARSRRARALVYLFWTVVVLGLAWRAVRYAVGLPIWGDEAFVAVNLSSRGFMELLAPLEYQQIVPLGYLWISRLSVILLGDGENALRLPAFISGVASMLLLAFVAGRVLSRRAAVLAVAIFAASYYCVRHGAEVKPYAGDTLVALCLIAVGWATYRQPTPTRWAGLIALGALAAWLSYPAIFVGLTVASLLAARAWRERRASAIIAPTAFAIVMAASFALMYVTFGRPHGHAAAEAMVSTWDKAYPPAGLALPLWLVDVHTGNMMAYPMGGKNAGSTATTLLVVVGAVALWRQGRRDLLWLMLGPLAWGLAAASVRAYPYGTSARTMQYIAPAICLLAGYGLWTAISRLPRPQWRPRAMAIATGLLGAIIAVGIVRDVAMGAKDPGDQITRDAIAALGAEAAPGEQWYVYNALEAVDYAPRIYDDTGSAAVLRYYIGRHEPTPTAWGVRPEAIGTDGARVRLLLYRDNENSLDEGLWRSYLDAAIARLGPPQRRLVAYVDRKGRPTAEAIEVFTFEPAAEH